METDLSEALAEALAMDGYTATIEGQGSGTQIGANVAWYSGSRANNIVIFINQLKGARPWDDPANTDRLEYDENGYPRNVPESYIASKLLIRSHDVAGVAPHTGPFRLYGVGIGVFSLIGGVNGQLANHVDTRALPIETINGVDHWYIDFDFSIGNEDIGQLRMQIHALQDGAHIQSLALVHNSHLPAFRSGQVFAPELIDDLDDYEMLRLMDWMRANRIEEDGNGWKEEGSNWTSPNPEQRYVSTDYYTFNNHAGGENNEGRFEVSVPIEHIVALANATHADPWITLPVDITDSRAEQLGRYVAANLDPDLVSRWEYGNELFNGAIGFEGFRYSIQMANRTFGDFNEEGPWAAVEWAAYRGPQLYDLLEDTFEDADRDTRFVAPGWAFSGSLRNDGSLTNGYLVRYFQAEQAQAMRDGTPLPLDVVTDYTVAMYFGGTLASGRPDAGLVDHIMATQNGAEAQAQTMADWLLFGAGGHPVIELGVDHLSQPRRSVVWSDRLEIAVTALVWDDIQAGLDPLNGLENVLRIDGRTLQYRGVNAQRWTDVLIFDAPPTSTLAQMIDAVQLVGYGGKLFGEIYHGARSGLALSTKFRLDAHADYARALGLNFVAYEGGSHASYPPEGAFEMYDAFNTGTAGARVFARWLLIMSEKGLTEYAHFMSHDRTNGNDWWGVKAYIGQDVSNSPEAIVLRGAIDAYDPSIDTGFTGPLRMTQAVRTTPNGALLVDLPVRWQQNDAWQVTQDGTARETAGTNTQLRLTQQLPVTGGLPYQFSFDVGLSGIETTELRFVARASGGEAREIVRWQGEVSDGVRVTFDLGELLPSESLLSVVVQRVGRDRSGEVTLRNADLAPAPQ